MKERKVDPMSLPQLKKWQAQFDDSMGVWNFLSREGSATLAIAYSTLFWPSFIEVQSCVLLRHRYKEETFIKWLDHFGGRARDVEAMINHVHLWDLFDPESEGVPEEAMEDLAYIVSKCWEAALRDSFPSRSFEVTVSSTADDYGPTITFSSSTSPK
jgi:hypothetical protein